MACVRDLIASIEDNRDQYTSASPHSCRPATRECRWITNPVAPPPNQPAMGGQLTKAENVSLATPDIMYFRSVSRSKLRHESSVRLYGECAERAVSGQRLAMTDKVTDD
jgi:hypothetical protein